MRALDLDYQRSARRSPWAGWVLLVVAVAFAVDLGLNYLVQKAQMQRDEARAAQLARGLPGQSQVKRDPKALEAPQIQAVSPEVPELQAGWRTWTDDYSNLVQILK